MNRHLNPASLVTTTTSHPVANQSRTSHASPSRLDEALAQAWAYPTETSVAGLVTKPPREPRSRLDFAAVRLVLAIQASTKEVQETGTLIAHRHRLQMARDRYTSLLAQERVEREKVFGHHVGFLRAVREAAQENGDPSWSVETWAKLGVHEG